MPKWIHDRAEHILAKNPSMDKSTAFAIATQQSHVLSKSPKNYGTSEGRETAKEKYDTPEDDQKTASEEKPSIKQRLSWGAKGAKQGLKYFAERPELIALPAVAALGTGLLMRKHASSILEELEKIGAISDAHAQAALDRLETLERNKPTVGQVGRYGALGAAAGVGVGALTDAIGGAPRAGLRGMAGRAVGGALTSGAIPLVRSHMDRGVERSTLKKYLHQQKSEAPGKLVAPFEPVEKSASVGKILRAARTIADEIDPRFTQSVGQTVVDSAIDATKSRGKEKDSGASGITPARSFAAGPEYDVSLVKGAFATSAYSANIGYPTAPQKSFQPGFRAPRLDRVAQNSPQQIKTGFKLQGHMEHQGLEVAVENRKGSVRKGVDKDGTPWRTKMKYPYGYIEDSKGADGEEVDCYVGPVKDATHAYVVHQKKDDGSYDEDKVMLGFASEEDARKAYLAHYNTDKFLGPIKTVPMERLHELLLKRKKLVKIAFVDKVGAGAPTRGNFMMASEVPGFRAPQLKSPVQAEPQRIVTKFANALDDREDELAREDLQKGLRSKDPKARAFARKEWGPLKIKSPKLAAATTPLGRLASSKSVGLPKVTAPPGPSIQQIAKPHGFGKPIAGATKTLA